MLRVPVVLALGLVFAPALTAQDKPTAAMPQAVSGTWKLDPAHSDTVPADPMSRGAGPRGFSGGGSRGGGGGGAAAGGGGGGGRGRTAAPPPPPVDTVVVQPPPPVQDRGGGADPNLRLVMAEVNPGAGLVVAANDSTVAMATANVLKANPNAVSNWKTDGKKYQDAQMDGTITESQSGWRDGVLTIMYGVVGVGSFTQEFKLGRDGKTLELKETVLAGGRKAEYKLSFNR